MERFLFEKRLRRLWKDVKQCVWDQVGIHISLHLMYKSQKKLKGERVYKLQ